MDDVFESLTKEVKIIQSRDPHFKGRRHVHDSYFYTDLYKEELKNTDDEYTEYDVYYDEKSKDEVMIEAVSLLDCYSEIYKVPTVRISNKEWDILFEEVYDFYTEYDLNYFFEQDMLMLNRLAISRSLLYNKKYLDISDYINSFNYLDSMVLTEGEKKTLNKRVDMLCDKEKVIPMEKFLQKKFDRRV